MVAFDLEKFYNETRSRSIGMDRLFDLHRTLLESNRQSNSFPFYNIKKLGDTEFVIELALAGFSIEDIDIVQEKSVLKISSKGKQVAPDSMIYQGFAFRSFERLFTLADNVKVEDATLLNGILSVRLQAIVPEENKPRKIAINSSSTSQKMLLNE